MTRVAALLMLLLAVPTLAQESPPAKWEKEVAAMEARDAKAGVTKADVVFVGSSSIRLWDVKKAFPDIDAVNHGFGGSQLIDSVNFAERLVTKYEPRVVVLYAGDNDLASGKSPEQVAQDFAAFVAAVHDKLPETKIVYVAVKPSIARWKLIEKVRDTNQRIAELCKQDEERLVFLDIQPLMLGEDGMPDPTLFVKDGLHMSAAGYAQWNEKLLPHLK